MHYVDMVLTVCLLVAQLKANENKMREGEITVA